MDLRPIRTRGVGRTNRQRPALRTLRAQDFPSSQASATEIAGKRWRATMGTERRLTGRAVERRAMPYFFFAAAQAAMNSDRLPSCSVNCSGVPFEGRLWGSPE